MLKKLVAVLSLTIGIAALLVVPAAAQTSNYETSIATPSGSIQAFGSGAIHSDGPLPGAGVDVGIRPPTGFPFPGTALDARIVWKDNWICRAFGPAEVTGFHVVCGASTFLDFHVADCCIPGDHWQLKGKAWDTRPNTGVTTAPGPVPVFSVPGRVYNYVAGGLDAYVECSYQHGVNVFPADSFVIFSSDGACTVTPDPAVRRIDRTP
jgi:hypothetical protein